uniref:ATP synthase CF0 subunit IV n=1 Tax=Cephaleuros virescens TaxID=173371 RepID=UPI001EDDE735|nr:ATP synthase CF0 subunit IV [Cephaleuros virescens]UIB38651.1 ATP synthase CF0 subunit IV [Cephaleuros virescens]
MSDFILNFEQNYQFLNFIAPAEPFNYSFFFNGLNSMLMIGEIKIGEHFYWNLFNTNNIFLLIHGQVVITATLVFLIIITFSFAANRQLKPTPEGLQNSSEYLTEFIRDLTKTQIGTESNYLNWVPFTGTLFLFIWISNWTSLIPFRLISLPEGELTPPTVDINVTTALALLTSIAYFYAGISKKGLLNVLRARLNPLTLLEDFTKPLSLSFRLFGNILADDLAVSVLVLLVPLFIPVPLMLLGLFTSSIQALVFSTLAAAYIGESLEDHH